MAKDGQLNIRQVLLWQRDEELLLTKASAEVSTNDHAGKRRKKSTVGRKGSEGWECGEMEVGSLLLSCVIQT